MTNTSKRSDIVRDCGVRAARFDREHGNRQKTRDEFRNVVEDFLDEHKYAGDAFDAHSWSFMRLVADAFRMYQKHCVKGAG